MPYALPADMARQLLYLAGDKVDFDPWKKKLLEGGWMPRGGSGRSAGGGGGEIVQGPKPLSMQERNARRVQPTPEQQEQYFKDWEKLAGRPLTSSEKYQEALALQRKGYDADFANPPQMPSFNPQMTNPYPSKPMAQSYQERQPIPIRPQDTAQTSFPGTVSPQDMALRQKMELARWGRILTPQERETLYRPGWEQPQ